MINITKKLEETDGPLYYVQVNDSPSFAFTLTRKQLEELYIEACRWLFDNILEQNKDMLIRLRNNEPAIKLLNSDEVIEWLKRNTSMFWESPCNPSKIVKYFKIDFGL